MSHPTSQTVTMRFGLVGTGPWASTVHGPGLVAAGGVDLVGVWGRDPTKTAASAERLGVTGHNSLEAMIDDVDALAFAVPPDVQAVLALQAAAAGRHLLLDKPVATSAAAAQQLAEVAAEHRVASVVFFTDRFSVGSADWFQSLDDGRWAGASVRWLASLADAGNPAAGSDWRHEKGALWDIGPHALSTLTAALGPVQEITCVGGCRDLVHLVLRHDSGATSTATLTLFAPPAAAQHEVLVWGERGLSRMPDREPSGDLVALGRAARALAVSAATGEDHPAGLRLGVRIVELLELAQRQL